MNHHALELWRLAPDLRAEYLSGLGLGPLDLIDLAPYGDALDLAAEIDQLLQAALVHADTRQHAAILNCLAVLAHGRGQHAAAMSMWHEVAPVSGTAALNLATVSGDRRALFRLAAGDDADVLKRALELDLAEDGPWRLDAMQRLQAAVAAHVGVSEGEALWVVARLAIAKGGPESFEVLRDVALRVTATFGPADPRSLEIAAALATEELDLERLAECRARTAEVLGAEHPLTVTLDATFAAARFSGLQTEGAHERLVAAAEDVEAAAVRAAEVLGTGHSDAVTAMVNAAYAWWEIASVDPRDPLLRAARLAIRTATNRVVSSFGSQHPEVDRLCRLAWREALVSTLQDTSPEPLSRPEKFIPVLAGRLLIPQPAGHFAGADHAPFRIELSDEDSGVSVVLREDNHQLRAIMQSPHSARPAVVELIGGQHTIRAELTGSIAVLGSFPDIADRLAGECAFVVSLPAMTWE